MPQDVIPGKDIYFGIADKVSSGTQTYTVLSGEGSGLGTVTYSDPAEIVDKLGTGAYMNRYDTGKRLPTCTLNVQIGSITEPALVGKHGVLQACVYGKQGNTAGDPRIRFDAFIVEPTISTGGNEAPIVDFELMIDGEPDETPFP